MTPEECRAARAALNWSPEALATWAGVARLTVINFESGARMPRAGTLIALRRALRPAGAPVPELGSRP